MITVVIPTYNRPKKLRRAVESIFNQTMLPSELIIVDDGSSPAIDLNTLGQAPSEIEVFLIRNNKPKGANSARNAGILRASSEWISFLDDDDEFCSEKIEILTDKIRSLGKDIDLIFHGGRIVMPEIGVNYASNSKDCNLFNLRHELLLRNVIGGNSFVTVRKSKLIEAGLFWEKLPALQDQEMWLRLARSDAIFHFIPNELVIYDQSLEHDSITKSEKKYEVSYALLEQRYEVDFKSLEPIDKHNLQKYRLQSSVHRALLRSDKLRAARKQLLLLRKEPNIRNLILLVLCFIGTRLIYKLRQWI